MPKHDQYPLHHSSQYNVDSACGHCDGIIRHERWCVTQSVSVQYAFRALSDPRQLSLEDELILHSLGVLWNAERTQSKLRRLK